MIAINGIKYHLKIENPISIAINVHRDIIKPIKKNNGPTVTEIHCWMENLTTKQNRTATTTEDIEHTHTHLTISIKCPINNIELNVLRHDSDCVKSVERASERENERAKGKTI